MKKLEVKKDIKGFKPGAGVGLRIKIPAGNTISLGQEKMGGFWVTDTKTFETAFLTKEELSEHTR